MNRENFNVKDVGCFLSWPAIILGFIIFFPLGFVQLYMRSQLDPFSAKSVGKFLKVVGVLGIIWAVLLILIGMGEPDYPVGFLVAVFLLPNILVWFIGRNVYNKAVKSIAYLSFVLQQQTRSISAMAQAMKTSEASVQEELNKLIANNLLTGYTVDPNVGMIYPLGTSPTAMQHTAPTPANNQTQVSSESYMTINGKKVKQSDMTPEQRKLVAQNIANANKQVEAALGKGLFGDAFDDLEDIISSASTIPKEVNVACPGCGAPCTLNQGTSIDCEFCGSKVTA